MSSPHTKKILFLITKGNFGGAQRYVYELAEAAQAAGHTVSVTCGSEGLLTDLLTEKDIPVRITDALQRDINPLSELRALWQLVKLIKEENPEVLHINSSKAGILGSIAARACGVPKIIFTAHGWPFYENRSLLWKSAAWLGSYCTTLFAHNVIVVSEHDLKHARMYGLTHKITCIKTAVATFDQLPKDEARTSLHSHETLRQHHQSVWMVSVAELTANKNLQHAISALARHNQSARTKIFYTIIGDGEQRTILEKHIRRHDVSRYVRLVGYKKDARSLLQAFDIFFLPSQKEGLPYALLEAAAAGSAVVASNVGGIPEVIAHLDRGLLVDPHDVESMSRALGEISRESQRSTYARKLKQFVDEHHALSKMLSQTLALYTTPPK